MKAANPLPVLGLLGVLLACAITSYLLVPSQKQLLTRLVQDGKTQRALDVFHAFSQTEKASDPEFYELMRLRLSRQLLNPNDKAGITAQLEESLKTFQRRSSSQDFLAEVLHSISLLNDCEQALRLVEPYLETIPNTARERIVRVLVKDALASNKPDIAAATYQSCLHHFPPGETNLVEAVRLWRAAANPDRALSVLEDFEQRSGKSSSALGPTLMELKFNLLREVGRNREAFDLASGIAARQAVGGARQKWLKFMQANAGDATQRRILLKFCRQNVQMNPADAETWRLIAEISVADGELDSAREALQKAIALRPEDLAAQEQLAQLYEWDNEPNLAFDLYLKLAQQNDLSALERLIALNPGLYRDKDLLRLLRGLSGEAHHDKYRLILARLLTKYGEYPEAYALYREHLQQKPKDGAVMEEYARLLQRQQDYESALRVWKSLQNLKPDDEMVRGHIAEVYYLLGDFENSLRAYQQLAKCSTDLVAIQKYCTLAESMGDLQSLSEALTLEIRLKTQGAPEDFIKLAYVFNLLGADGKRQRVLERGLVLYPDNDALRIQLSILLVEMRKGEQALPVLARSQSLKTDPDVLRLYLDLLIERGDYASAEKFVKTGIDETLLETESLNLLQGVIYEGNQDDVAAEKIYQKLYQQHPGESAHALNYLHVLTKLGKTRKARSVLQPLLKNPTPEILKEASRVSAELGDYQEAEKLQVRVMGLRGEPRFQDWSYLGDIRYSAGKQSAARRAYRQALASAEIHLQSLPP
jgi:tetratricopeptide (TPR) repeat protein